MQRVYGSRRRLPIYNTEYGYITHPPNRGPFVSPATAAYYLNWAEYLSWKQARIASTMQYLLYDPRPAQTQPGDGGFASGLEFADGKREAEPRRLPAAALSAGQRQRAARPGARGVGLRTPRPLRDPRHRLAAERADPVRAAGAAGASRRCRRVLVGEPSDCYFDVRIGFPASGTVRLAYTYPAGMRQRARRDDRVQPQRHGRLKSR